MMAMFLLGALMLPATLFGLALYVGAEHGNDLCVYDLDGLLTWFGVLGTAGLVLNCADTALEWPSRASLLLRMVLLVFPWVGVSWTYRLSGEQQVICGRVLSAVSEVFWTVLLLLELSCVCFFCWGLAVILEHESSLQHTARSDRDSNPRA